MTESMSHTEVTCVADFLNILKNDVEELSNDKERFFRGLSNTDYIETDYPSIYRFPDNNPKYEPYIKYEHEMFYDLVSRFPEQFSACKNTFEHLVMMQHYGFPTRLLDVTSNPLVALYFCCVDQKEKNNEKDGIVLAYDIPNKQIKGYNSDTVTILSNLARISQEYQPFHSYFNKILNNFKMLTNNTILANINITFIKNSLNELNNLITQHNNLCITSGVLYEKKKIQTNIKELLDNINNPIGTDAKTKIKIDNLESIKKEIVEFSKWLVHATDFYPYDIDLKFKHLIKEEKNYFVHEIINPSDLTSFFCVKPKLNNPRIINQNGAFLLFGFAGKDQLKNTSPTIHFNSRARINKKEEGIIIKKDYKSPIRKELEQLGIHRAFIFPEIDSVSQVVANNYKHEK